ncbi:ATPase AAA [Eubacteriales bacterium]|uniref:ATP-binding protein n=1 Tax=Anaerotruncus sp. AF02-27 TaxID=2292191 RepID=UPI000E4C6EAD|nr:ATP-binding protein [Anaerotruncus sp. AF02-27]MCM0707262.1 ATP-binding protein [Faecalicatena sp. BF-R-105]RGX55051.1 ATP-binding protein [Anaerotruncus sp. AF02-27]GKH49916.1 ATPase AAA [Eubacteriales bacterium]GKH62552.1 ATPase AAA [Eubacteriales bacterium]
MFYCRENELEQMTRRYEKGKFECVVIYGRRRVGKTALINEFCMDKPTIYFSALNASSGENLEALSKAIETFKNPAGTSFPVYRSFSDALDEITALAQKQRLIFVIDEYPYLAKAEKSFSSRLQHIIDHLWQESQIYLILCGSSMSFMEYQVLGYESPLYGRRTAQLKIHALTYREMTVFHPELSIENQALLYGVTGGIPHYINKLEVEESLDNALLQNLFDTSSYLFEEPENLLKQELREPTVYNSVISAIAGGASRSNEIATKVGIESGVCAKYLRVLLELGILKKETPITEKPGKKTIYAIDDNFFRFWYRFVPRNMSAISAGRFAKVYDRAVKQYFSEYMGLVFEKMCQDYLMRYADNLPILLSEVGQWWGTDSKTRKQVQIDIVGTPTDGDEYLIGSCKYRNEKIGLDELELLRSYAAVFGKGRKYHYYIFSKGGFTSNLAEQGQLGEVTLLTLEDLYRSKPQVYSPPNPCYNKAVF